MDTRYFQQKIGLTDALNDYALLDEKGKFINYYLLIKSHKFNKTEIESTHKELKL